MAEITTPDGRYTLSFEFSLVTQERARRWLAADRPPNRSILRSHVADLARDKREGRWHPATGDVIRFDEKGRLIDGQHRLSMIVTTGQATILLICRGVPSDALPFIDINRRRTVRELSRMMGHFPGVSDAVRWAWRFENGPGAVKVADRLTPSKALELIPRIPGIVDSVEATSNPKLRSLVGSTGGLAVLHLIMSRANPASAERFFADLAIGAGLDAESPIHKVRDRLMISGSRGSGGGSLAVWVRLALIVRAWNHFVTGRKAALIVRETDPFPDIAGWGWTTLFEPAEDPAATSPTTPPAE